MVAKNARSENSLSLRLLLTSDTFTFPKHLFIKINKNVLFKVYAKVCFPCNTENFIILLCIACRPTGGRLLHDRFLESFRNYKEIKKKCTLNMFSVHCTRSVYEIRKTLFYFCHTTFDTTLQVLKITDIV